MTISRRTLTSTALAGGVIGALPAAAQTPPRAAAGAAASGVQVAFPQSFAQVTMPADGVVMPAGYVKAMAQFAYVWGWPLVSQFNRRAGITQAPAPGLMGGIVPVAPRGRIAMLVDYVNAAETFIACPNQDVVYGLGFFALDAEPAVIQVPDFGDRFWVYALYDARTDQFAKLGKPYGTRRGFYLLAGPNWRGRVPAGITATIRSSTELANTVPRVFMDDTAADRAAIRPLVNQVVAYPLAEFDGRMKTVDYARLPAYPAPAASADGGETRWVVPETFFTQLPAVMDGVAPLPGEEAIYANIRQLLGAAARDPAIAALLTQAAVEAERSVLSDFLQWKHNGVPAGNNWNRSKNNAQWGVDYFNRTGTAKSNMYDNKPDETQYFYTDVDAAGAQLQGANQYAITFARGQLPPVRGFWSLTLYDSRHLFAPNSLNRYSLGTKNRGLATNPDGSLTLYAGKESPGADKAANWLPAPDGTFCLYIRAYWGQQPILDGTWQPPKVEKRA
jgi:hypothetical protein